MVRVEWFSLRPAVCSILLSWCSDVQSSLSILKLNYVCLIFCHLYFYFYSVDFFLCFLDVDVIYCFHW